MDDDDELEIDVGESDLDGGGAAEPADELSDDGVSASGSKSVSAAGCGRSSGFEGGSGHGGSRRGSRGRGDNARGRGGGKGTKFCSGCNKYHPISDFPAGKAMCGMANNAIRNIKSAAIAQKQTEWFKQVQDDPNSTRLAIKAYLMKCGRGDKQRAKKNAFCIANYREEVRQTSGTYFDAEMEMLNLLAYQKWVALPENGGYDPEEAKARWIEFRDAPNAICDDQGPKKYKTRVAIKVRDVVKIRDGQERNKIITACEKDVRKASQQDVDALELRLQRDSSWKGSCAVSRAEEARRLAESRIAAVAAGSEDGAFSSDGKASLVLGDVTELAPPGFDEGTDPDEGGEGGGGGGDHDGPSALTPSKANAKAKTAKKDATWFARDEKIMGELRKMREYQEKLVRDLKSTRTRCEAVRASIPPQFKRMVEAEENLLNNRLRAIKLVLSDPTAQEDAPTAVQADQEKENQELLDEKPLDEKPEKPLDEKPMGPNGLAEKEGSEDSAAAEVPAKGGAGDDGITTVRGYVAQHGGPEKALRKYIASFGDGSQANELGSRPPCRSFRSLRLTRELFQEYEQKIRNIKAKHEVASVLAFAKPYKAAYNELLSLANAAVNRCENAVKSAVAAEEQRLS
jgi:hypothetical protein